MDLSNVRSEYQASELNLEDLNSLPIEQLKKWMNESKDLKYSNAATLSTIDKEGFPNSRVVLIKEIKEDSLTFYTSYESEKARDIENNNKASFNIYWKEFDRQIRIQGLIERTSFEVSDKYFQSRPFESQIAAISSPQSQNISIKDLSNRFEQNKTEFKNSKVPTPLNWGGYTFKIRTYEFWQGRPSRLHDRFKYTYNNDNWSLKRLAP